MLTVPNELALTESRSMRAAAIERVDVLDKVKALALLPDGLHLTTDLVAQYYEVDVEAIHSVVRRHRQELTENGMHTLRGAELRDFEVVNLTSSTEQSNRRVLRVFSRRALLDVGMVLTESEVAKRVRTYLLDSEAERQSQAAVPQSHGELEMARRVIGLQDQVLALATSNADMAVRLADMAPKAEGYDDLIAAEGLFDMATAAKILAPVTGRMGRTRFLNQLRGMRVIIQNSTLPYQHLIDRGYFAVRTDVVNGKARPATVVTAKGLRWLQAEFREEHPTLNQAPQRNVVQLPQPRQTGELA
jgi:phage antirepressor YoqD-like protein